MKTATIRLSSINDVKEFVNMLMRHDGDFELTSGKYTVDAKSIMGIFSLDLSKPLKFAIHEDSDEIWGDIKKYIIKED